MGEKADSVDKGSKALVDPRRLAIVEALRRSPRGLDTNGLADRLGLHPNTARWHLGILADAGLVDARPERHGRGRPSIVYRLTAEAAARGRDEYRLLATMLTGLAAEAPEGEARAYETGRRWGRYLVEQPPPNRRTGERDALETVVDLLDEQGFAAAIEEGEVCMRRCPFYALAETNPEIVCTMHRGLIDGALEQVGARSRVERLDVFVEPSLCVAHVGHA